MLIMGYINQLCGETPTDLRIMGVPARATNFVGLTVTLTDTQRKTAINAPTNQAETHVCGKIDSRRNLNASPCSGSTLTRTTLLCGLRVNSLDP
jgi:hypothetical protein